MSVNELYGFGATSTVVTPSDSAEFAPARGFMPATDGAVAIAWPDGTSITVPACKAGIQYAFNGFTQVLATGTGPTSVLVGR